MLLAGLPVPDRLVLELAQCIRAEGLYDTAEILEDAYDGECDIVDHSLHCDEGDAIARPGD
jgi:hypothetical protein